MQKNHILIWKNLADYFKYADKFHKRKELLIHWEVAFSYLRAFPQSLIILLQSFFLREKDFKYYLTQCL